MNKMKILPYKAVGPLKFGMSRSEAHAAIGNPSRTIQKVARGPIVDQYLTLGLNVNFGSTENEPLFLVEFWGPDAAVIKDIELGTAKLKEINRALENSGEPVWVDSEGFFWFDTLGICLFADGESHGVSVFSQKEYEKTMKFLKRPGFSEPEL